MDVSAGAGLAVLTSTGLLLSVACAPCAERIESMRRQLAVNSNTSTQDLESIQTTELLGEGTFGKVYKGLWRGSVVAVSHALHAASLHCIPCEGQSSCSEASPVMPPLSTLCLSLILMRTWLFAVICGVMVVCFPRAIFAAGLSPQPSYLAPPWHIAAVQVKTMLLPANMSGAEKREKM